MSDEKTQKNGTTEHSHTQELNKPSESEDTQALERPELELGTVVVVAPAGTPVSVGGVDAGRYRKVVLVLGKAEHPSTREDGDGSAELEDAEDTLVIRRPREGTMVILAPARMGVSTGGTEEGTKVVFGTDLGE